MESVKPPATDKIVYWLADSHPEGVVLVAVATSLGFKEVLSDLFFLRSIQYFGNLAQSKESRFKKTYPLFRAIAAASPHFIPGYSFGALVIEETGYVNEAIAFLGGLLRETSKGF